MSKNIPPTDDVSFIIEYLPPVNKEYQQLIFNPKTVGNCYMRCLYLANKEKLESSICSPIVGLFYDNKIINDKETQYDNCYAYVEKLGFCKEDTKKFDE